MIDIDSKLLPPNELRILKRMIELNKQLERSIPYTVNPLPDWIKYVVNQILQGRLLVDILYEIAKADVNHEFLK